MGKQAKSAARTRRPPDVPRPRLTDWRGQPTKTAQAIARECERLWLPPEPEAFRVSALQFHSEDWPRSACGDVELDVLLDDLYRLRPPPTLDPYDWGPDGIPQGEPLERWGIK